jgi:hypothetical protein
MRTFWRWLLDCLEALADDDRNTAQAARDHENAQKRFPSYLGSGKE